MSMEFVVGLAINALPAIFQIWRIICACIALPQLSNTQHRSNLQERSGTTQFVSQQVLFKYIRICFFFSLSSSNSVFLKKRNNDLMIINCMYCCCRWSSLNNTILNYCSGDHRSRFIIRPQFFLRMATFVFYMCWIKGCSSG